MALLRRFLLLIICTLAFAGCATDNQQQAVDSSGNAVSTIPWNRPEGWEGQGMLGGMSGTQ